MRKCYRCETGLDDKVEVFRASMCASCGADLRCCLNCRFYSRGAHWDCHETVDEQVVEKARANFCSWFRFKDSSGQVGGVRPKEPGKAHDAFDKLFGG